jgi:hypothetical protein
MSGLLPGVVQPEYGREGPGPMEWLEQDHL